MSDPILSEGEAVPRSDEPSLEPGVPTDASEGASENASDRSVERDLFLRYRETGDRHLRNQLVERNLHLVEPHIRRFEGRGVPTDDLRQVGLLAVLKAVERFDPDYGVVFATFAGRTIDGELKRYLRDRGWSVRPSRRNQEVYLSVRKAEDGLVQSLGRSPRVAELARAVDESEDTVLEALEAGGARYAASLDQPAGPDRPEPVVVLGGAEAGLGQVEVRMLVTDLLDSLDERDREVISLRFFDDLGQPEIAERLGLSQSYVSRLIRRILLSLRAQLVDGDAGIGVDDDIDPANSDSDA